MPLRRPERNSWVRTSIVQFHRNRGMRRLQGRGSNNVMYCESQRILLPLGAHWCSMKKMRGRGGSQMGLQE